MGGRVLAVDPGSRRIGLAVSDSDRRVALPLEVIPAGESSIEVIARLIREYEVGEIVVGLPLRLDGSEGRAAAGARAWAERLRERVAIPVHLFDERLTTVAADRALTSTGMGGRRRRKVVDRTAATLLLQTYLQAGGRERS